MAAQLRFPFASDIGINNDQPLVSMLSAKLLGTRGKRNEKYRGTEDEWDIETVF